MYARSDGTLRDWRLTLIGGATILLEVGGLRLLTDPTFDPAGSKEQRGAVTLTKTAGPALAADALGRIDAVLLSHDQHYDNLDRSGRELLARGGPVFTTPAAGQRLGGNALGLHPWGTAALPPGGSDAWEVTATPARHGPPGTEPVSGEVTGFLLACKSQPGAAIYISGDTVGSKAWPRWRDGIASGLRCCSWARRACQRVGPKR